MLKNLKSKINEIDKKILNVINHGFKCCIFLTFISCFILVTYHHSLKTPDLYYSGILLFKTSLFFMVDFIICGFAIDTIKKQE